MPYWSLPIIGFLVGLLIVSLGGGGGAIYVGVLTTLFNVPPAVAASTSLATAIPTAGVGAFSHWRVGNVNVRVGAIMIGAGAAGTILGSLVSGYVPDALYNKLIGVILVALTCQMVWSSAKSKRANKAGEADPSNKSSDAPLPRTALAKALAYGFGGGFISGIAGLSGGGPITAGLMTLGCGMFQTVGTSIFVLFGISTVGFLMHLSLGGIDWQLTGLLVMGTILGSLVGPPLLKRLGRERLEPVLRVIIIVINGILGVVQLLK